MSETPPSKTARRPNGQFDEGNDYGRSPISVHKRNMNEAIRNATNSDQVVKVWQKLEQMALNGDLGAIREYLNRACGSGTPFIETDGQDGNLKIMVIRVDASEQETPVVIDTDASSKDA